MKIPSSMSPRQYLQAMKDQMQGHFQFGAERYTGFFLGNIFCVTYHSGYEWNRRITSEKNCALGFIRKTEDGCTVHCFRTKGMLCPPQFLLYFLMCTICLALVTAGDIPFLRTYPLLYPVLGLGISAVVAPIESFFESISERSYEGGKILIAFLIDPADPFSYLHNQNKLI